MLPVKVMPPKAVAWITNLQEAELEGSNVAQVRTYEPYDVASKPMTWFVPSFQTRVEPWMLECFNEEIMMDGIERNHRLYEEATETVQSGGMTRSEMHQIVDYVCDRPVGEKAQEVGGLMVTAAAWCIAHGVDMNDAAETELARVWTMVDKIRAKQAAKPKFSPLPARLPFREAVEAMVSMLEAGEWAEHIAMTTGKGDPLAYRLEDQLTRLHNEIAELHERLDNPAKCADLQGLADNLVTLQALPRDADGHFYHPAMPVFDEGVRRDVFLASLGLEFAFVDMESDAPHLMDNEGDGEHKLVEWMPTTPEIPSGQNRAAWALIEISDTENGPYAMFVRRESPPEFNDRMHSKRYPDWVNRETVPGDLSSGIIFRTHYAGLSNMRSWMLGSLPSALRAIVYPISFPPFPAWMVARNGFRATQAQRVGIAPDQYTAVRNSLECAALWLENGSDPLEAAAEIRLAAARVQPVSTDAAT